MALVGLDRVTKRYAPDRPPAVDGLTLDVSRGEILALLGPSGLRQDHDAPADRRLRGARRGVHRAAGPGRGRAGPPRAARAARGRHGVPGLRPVPPPHRSGTTWRSGSARWTAAARRARIAQVLDLVGLADHADRYPHELSGGQQQRVAVARALAPAPAVLLLDEPFSSLDADLRSQMRDEVEKILRTTGTTAIFVTHDQEEAFTLADRVGVLNAGRLEQLATPEDIYHHPASQFVAEFVGAADFLPGVVTGDGIVTEVGHLRQHRPARGRRARGGDDPAGRHHLRARPRRGRRHHAALLPGIRDPLLHPAAVGPPGALVAAVGVAVHDRHPRPRRGPRAARRGLPRPPPRRPRRDRRAATAAPRDQPRKNVRRAR